MTLRIERNAFVRQSAVGISKARRSMRILKEMSSSTHLPESHTERDFSISRGKNSTGWRKHELAEVEIKITIRGEG